MLVELAVLLVLQPSKLNAVVPPVQELSPRLTPLFARQERPNVQLSVFKRAQLLFLLLGEFCVGREEKGKINKFRGKGGEEAVLRDAAGRRRMQIRTFV